MHLYECLQQIIASSSWPLSLSSMSCKKSSTPLSSSTCHLHLHLPLLAKLWKGRNCACSWYPGLKATIICSLYVLMVTTDEESSLSFQNLGRILWGKLHAWWMNTPSSGSLPPCHASHHWICQCLTPNIFFFATVTLWTLAFRNCPYAFIWGFVTPFDP